LDDGFVLWCNATIVTGYFSWHFTNRGYQFAKGHSQFVKQNFQAAFFVIFTG
jgi:hypothetical protein